MTSLRLTRLLTCLVCLLAFCGCASSPRPTPVPPPPNRDWSITATWNFDFTNFVPCSATITRGCVSSFLWGYMQGGTPVLLKTSLPAVCTGTTQPETCTDTTNATLGIGPVTPYIFAAGIDNNGNTVPSVTINGPVVTVTLSNVTNFGWSIK
jgi:hypothetical protein